MAMKSKLEKAMKSTGHDSIEQMFETLTNARKKADEAEAKRQDEISKLIKELEGSKIQEMSLNKELEDLRMLSNEDTSMLTTAMGTTGVKTKEDLIPAIKKLQEECTTKEGERTRLKEEMADLNNQLSEYKNMTIRLGALPQPAESQQGSNQKTSESHSEIEERSDKMITAELPPPSIPSSAAVKEVAPSLPVITQPSLERASVSKFAAKAAVNDSSLKDIPEFKVLEMKQYSGQSQGKVQDPNLDDVSKLKAKVEDLQDQLSSYKDMTVNVTEMKASALVANLCRKLNCPTQELVKNISELTDRQETFLAQLPSIFASETPEVIQEVQGAFKQCVLDSYFKKMIKNQRRLMWAVHRWGRFYISRVLLESSPDSPLPLEDYLGTDKSGGESADDGTVYDDSCDTQLPQEYLSLWNDLDDNMGKLMEDMVLMNEDIRITELRIAESLLDGGQDAEQSVGGY